MRSLHLLDVEYLGCGPTRCAGDFALVMDRYRDQAGWVEGDHLIGAASTWVYKRIAFDLPSDIRFLPAGGGPDAADRRLLDEASSIDLTRYDRLVVASGDHRFADLVLECRALGLDTCVAAYGFNTSRVLAGAASSVVDLAGRHALAA